MSPGVKITSPPYASRAAISSFVFGWTPSLLYS